MPYIFTIKRLSSLVVNLYPIKMLIELNFINNNIVPIVKNGDKTDDAVGYAPAKHLWFCKFCPECDKYLFFWPNTNTQYYSVFRNHQIPNIEYYLVLRKSKYWILNTIRVLRKSQYQIWIVLFGLTIQIPNTKYWTVYKVWGKKDYKDGSENLYNFHTPQINLGKLLPFCFVLYHIDIDLGTISTLHAPSEYGTANSTMHLTDTDILAKPIDSSNKSYSMLIQSF